MWRLAYQAVLLAPHGEQPEENAGERTPFRVLLVAAALDAGSATAYRGIGVVCMSQYVLDRSKIDLLDKALEAWNASLEIQSDQEDLRRLVQKYTPKYTAPEL